MYDDVEALAMILDYALSHFLIFRLFVYLLFACLICKIIMYFFFYRNKKRREDKKDEV